LQLPRTQFATTAENRYVKETGELKQLANHRISTYYYCLTVKAMSTDSNMQHATEQNRNQKIEEEARKSMAQILFSKAKRCFINRA
jgi:adenine-specific DNA methylase